ncbi:MAG: MATE family efflux transporter [Clostridiales bacterium]|nr:MATE family efflux transporter [Clostridiales bacterium]
MAWLRNLLVRLFSTRYMVKDKLLLGDIPPTKEAYQSAINIALPAVAEMVSISVIGMADTVMVGKLGTYAIAAVGLTAQARMIFLCVFFALNVGVTAVVSRRKGSGDQAAANLCLRQSLLIAICMAALMSVASVISARGLMILSGAQNDTIEPATQYFQILGMGMVFQVLSMVICAAQRGVGLTKITMYVGIVANVVNVIFNYLLIGGNFGFPRLEVRGAAIATVMGNAVGMALAIASVLRGNGYLRIRRSDSWKPDWDMLKILGKIGGGSMVEQLALRVGFFLYALVVANLGTDAFAAHQITMQLLGLSFTFADGIGIAATSLVGQSLGAKRPDLSIMYGQIGQRIAFIIALGLAGLSIAGMNFFPALFTNERHLIELSSSLIILLAIIQPFQMSQVVMSGALRGAGDTKYVALSMLLAVGIVRPAAAYLLTYAAGLGVVGAWWAILVDQIARLLFMQLRLIGGKWMKIEV